MERAGSLQPPPSSISKKQQVPPLFVSKSLFESKIDHKAGYGLSQAQLYVELVTQPAHRIVAWSSRNLLAIAANYNVMRGTIL